MRPRYSGPYGEQASSTTPPNTNVSGTNWGWHGEQKRISDRGLVHMGARLYAPTHGRFLSVDPIEGGCANDYMYVSGDPIQADDVSGKGWWDKVKCVASELNPFNPGGGGGVIEAGVSVGSAGSALIKQIPSLIAQTPPGALVSGTVGAIAAGLSGGALVAIGVVVIGIGTKMIYDACKDA